MKRLVLIALILTGATSFAKPISVDKAKNFIISKKKCDFAAAITFSNSPEGKTFASQCGGKPGDLATCGNNSTSDVFCVYYAKIEAGSINERKGCFASYLNLDNDGIRPFYDVELFESYKQQDEEGLINASLEEGKPCTKEVITHLLNRPSEPKISRTSGMPKVIAGNGNIWGFYQKQLIDPQRLTISVLADKFNVQKDLVASSSNPLQEHGFSSSNKKKSKTRLQPRGHIVWAETTFNGLKGKPQNYSSGLDESDLKNCFAKIANKYPSAQGKIVFQVKFGARPKSAVEDAQIISDDLKVPELNSCALERIKSWHYFDSNNGSTVVFPFAFFQPERD
jgi:hypothetical protein